MKDASVGPAGLFAPQRQRWLMDALATRFRACQTERRQLVDRHAHERADEEQRLLARRGEVTAECRRERRVTLAQWDAAEEQVFAGYEEETVRLRHELNRLASLYRRKSAEGVQAIEQKAQTRRAAVKRQYAAHKDQPGRESQRELEAISRALRPLNDELARAQELTVRRLDRLPAVTGTEWTVEEVSEPLPESVADAVESIGRLTQRCGELIQELQTGFTAKAVDSFYLPIAVAIAVAAWSLGVWLLRPPAFWLYLGTGIVAAGILGFAIYAALLLPLRRRTRQLFPRIQRIGQAAEEIATAGRNVSTEQAKAAAAELVRQRDQQLAAAERWQREQREQLAQRLADEERAARDELEHQLASLGSRFSTQRNRVNTEMHERAEQVAASITRRLSDTDEALHRERERNTHRRQEELRRVTERLRDGVRLGLDRIGAATESVRQRFPAWSDVVAAPQSEAATFDFVPLGKLRIAPRLERELDRQPTSPEAASDAGPDGAGNGQLQITPMFRRGEVPEVIPVAMHRRLHSGLLVRAAPAQLSRAVEVLHTVLWRLLSGVAGGRTQLTLIDPIGRGQNFTSFMSLADHDPGLVSHRVWTGENQIEARLGELAQHAEDVLQSSLRDQFERVEDYNLLAGSMAEPYQAVAAVGFPEGLTRAGHQHLRALIESGLRCGVYVMMVCREDQPWPADWPRPRDQRLLELCLNGEGRWSLECDGLRELDFVPEHEVPAELRPALVDKIGTAATRAAKVEIPLESVLPSASGDGTTDEGVDITIGSQGGQRTLALRLGEGVRQHVLIAGKTGSGKSTLLHSIITSGAYHYPCDQLQFYLLDFKKGVEFKAYADARLPHARVIGIESEREFGRSVLQRLDEELQRRGEQFRRHSTQELAEYRRLSGEAMPRVMLVIDEFQELFVRDDKLAAECAMLLDRLVRQGRSFGIHVILSSQSLAGAYSLPRATLGQMAVRIAMQCSESDAALILSDDNTAARLISRPGEAIYNDASGLIEGNQPFQVAWLEGAAQRRLLSQVAQRDAGRGRDLPPPVIFEGNRPGRWSPELAAAALGPQVAAAEELHGLLGEAVEIGPPAAIQLSRHAGRNVMMISPDEARGGLLASVLSGFAKSNPALHLVYFDGNRPSDQQSLSPWLEQAGFEVRRVKPRDAVEEMTRLVELVKERGDEAEHVPPVVAVIDPLDRFRDFRHDDAFSFSLDAPAGGLSGGQAMREVLKDGPPAHVYTILVCGSAEIVSRWLPRQSQHDVELRVLGRLNASDSSLLIDSPAASELSTATLLLYDEPEGRICKFRQLDPPDPAAVADWIAADVAR